MVADRQMIGVLVAVGVLTVPGCLLPGGLFPTPNPNANRVEPPPAVQTAKSPRGSQFAELIHAPGERIAASDPTTVIARGTPTADPHVSTVSGSVPVFRPEPLPPIGPVPIVITPPDPPLVAAIRAYVENRPEDAVKHLKSLDKSNQELMLQLIPALVRASQLDLSRATPHEIGVLAGQLDGPAAALATRGPLFVEKACFCRWVKNFGRYDPLPDRHSYPPGSLAELYLEVKNVPSEPTTSPPEGEGYVTRLACTLQLRDSSGGVVELMDQSRKPVPALAETKRDFTRSPIRDYFLLFRFPVPGKPGEYKAVVEVRDPATGRAVSKTLTLRVG